MTKLKWISNVFLDWPARRLPKESQAEAEQRQKDWLKDKILGEPSDAAKDIPGAQGVYVLESLQDG